MAEAADIAELRRLINEPLDVAPWTDEYLGERIDELGSDPNLRALAATIWREKAAAYAGLVDVKEGNSDRKLSQLYKQALDMGSSLDVTEAAAVKKRGSRTRPIERQ